MKKIDKVKKTALEEVREKYRDELEKTLDVNIGIRDGLGVTTVTCPKCKHRHVVEMTKDRDRIEASKQIFRVLGALVTTRAAPPTAQPLTPLMAGLDKPLSKKERDEIDRLAIGQVS